MTTLSSVESSARAIDGDECMITDGSTRLVVTNDGGNGATHGCLVDYASYPIVKVRLYNDHSFWTKIFLRSNLNTSVDPSDIWAKFGYIAPGSYAEYTLTFTPHYRDHSVIFFVNGVKVVEDNGLSAASLTIISKLLDVLTIKIVSAQLGDLKYVVETLNNSKHLGLATDALIQSNFPLFIEEFHALLNDDNEIAIMRKVAARFGVSISESTLQDLLAAVNIILTAQDIKDMVLAIQTQSYAGTVSFTSQKPSDGVVNTGTLNVRSGPSNSYPLSGAVTYNTELHILARNNDCSWIQVNTYPGIQGWIPTKYVNLNLKCNSVSVVAVPPPPVSSTTPSCIASGGKYTCTILATVGWQQTPLVIQPDTVYSIWYISGNWTVNAATLPYVGSDGYPLKASYEMPPQCNFFPAFVAYARLLIKIGERVIVPDRAEASTLLMGSSGHNRETGVLSIRINEKDECLDDNDGSIVVEVSLAPPILPTQPPPTGEVCGQYIRINQSPDKLPAFQPYGTNEVWIFDPVIFERYLADKFQEGSYVKIDNPSFGDDKPPAWGYPRVRYMEDSDDETIVPNCGTTPVISTPTPPEQQIDLAQLREKILSHVRNAAVSTNYHQQAQQLVDALLAHLDDFQLANVGITKETTIQALNKGDVGTRVNAAVQAIWGLWIERAKQGGFNVTDTDPGSFADVSPFRQLVIRMIQGHQRNLSSAEQHALYSYFTRKEDTHTWKDNMNGVIGAINRESFQAAQPTPIPPSVSTPAAPATPLPTGVPFQILSPRDGAILKCKPTFAWQDTVGLPPGHVYEIIIWKPGQEWAKDGRGITKADLRTSRDVDLNYLDDKQDWFAPGEYEWGVLEITPDPYTRHRMLGTGGRFTFVRDGTCQ